MIVGLLADRDSVSDLLLAFEDFIPRFFPFRFFLSFFGTTMLELQSSVSSLIQRIFFENSHALLENKLERDLIL